MLLLIWASFSRHRGSSFWRPWGRQGGPSCWHSVRAAAGRVGAGAGQRLLSGARRDAGGGAAAAGLFAEGEIGRKWRTPYWKADLNYLIGVRSSDQKMLGFEVSPEPSILPGPGLSSGRRSIVRNRDCLGLRLSQSKHCMPSTSWQLVQHGWSLEWVGKLIVEIMGASRSWEQFPTSCNHI